MAHVTILSRDDREGGATHVWLSYDGERARVSINTATLNAPDGFNVLTLMAQKAVEIIRTSRERGKLQLDG